MKQYEAVIQTLERLGGVATLGKLNKKNLKIKDSKYTICFNSKNCTRKWKYI